MNSNPAALTMQMNVWAPLDHTAYDVEQPVSLTLMTPAMSIGPWTQTNYSLDRSITTRPSRETFFQKQNALFLVLNLILSKESTMVVIRPLGKDKFNNLKSVDS